MAQKFKELLNGPAARQGKDAGGSGLGKAGGTAGGISGQSETEFSKLMPVSSLKRSTSSRTRSAFSWAMVAKQSRVMVTVALNVCAATAGK